MLLQQQRNSLEVISHAFCESAETNAGEEVDAKSSVFWIVLREHVTVRLLHRWFGETADQGLHAQILEHLLQENFDEDTGRRCGVILVHIHYLKTGPRDRI